MRDSFDHGMQDIDNRKEGEMGWNPCGQLGSGSERIFLVHPAKSGYHTLFLAFQAPCFSRFPPELLCLSHPGIQSYNSFDLDSLPLTLDLLFLLPSSSLLTSILSSFLLPSLPLPSSFSLLFQQIQLILEALTLASLLLPRKVIPESRLEHIFFQCTKGLSCFCLRGASPRSLFCVQCS